jgi:hypothetical protein
MSCRNRYRARRLVSQRGPADHHVSELREPELRLGQDSRLRTVHYTSPRDPE